MAIGIFGGSFDPVHPEHVNYAAAAIQELRLNKLYVVPANLSPFKREGAFGSPQDRLRMCRLAFRDLPEAEISDYEISCGDTSYSYRTAEHFAEMHEGEKIYFLVGADMLDDFGKWKEPKRLLAAATLAVCGRGEELSSSKAAAFEKEFGAFERVNFTGKDVSSTEIRTYLAFGKAAGLDEKVEQYIKEKGLYSYPAVEPALALEKPERREHSFRVALMATERARSVGVSVEKALLSSALHDCGKYVPLSSPMLNGFTLPEEVPLPVVHQYTGAYLAEHEFGIEDREILEAIKWHASGKRDMTKLEKLVYLADLLEPSRSFRGVERLRELFWKDLDLCFSESLREQIAYLESTGNPVYGRTYEAYEFVKNQ